MYVSDVPDASWPVGVDSQWANEKWSARERMDALLDTEDGGVEVPEQQPAERRRATAPVEPIPKKQKKAHLDRRQWAKAEIHRDRFR